MASHLRKFSENSGAIIYIPTVARVVSHLFLSKTSCKISTVAEITRGRVKLQIRQLCEAGEYFELKHRGRDPSPPPPGSCRHQNIVVETLIDVAHHYAYLIERFPTPCGVCYDICIVQSLHEDCFTPILRRKGGPGYLCV